MSTIVLQEETIVKSVKEVKSTKVTSNYDNDNDRDKNPDIEFVIEKIILSDGYMNKMKQLKMCGDTYNYVGGVYDSLLNSIKGLSNNSKKRFMQIGLHMGACSERYQSLVSDEEISKSNKLCTRDAEFYEYRKHVLIECAYSEYIEFLERHRENKEFNFNKNYLYSKYLKEFKM